MVAGPRSLANGSLARRKDVHGKEIHRVLVVGPSPDQVGGIAGMVTRHLAANLEGRYRQHFFPMTFRESSSETLAARVLRHWRHSHRLGSLIRSTGSTIVHLHTCSGVSFYRSLLDLWTARRWGSRTVLHIHGAAFDRFFDRAGPIGQQVVRTGLARADVVVALSAWWRDRLRRMSLKARITVIENAVDFPEAPVRQARRGGAFRFVLLARMDAWKGIDDALDAMALLRDRGQTIHLTLAGPEGTAGDTQALRGKIAARGIEHMANCLGCVEGAAKHRLLAESDCLIQPSHHEGMPLAILEGLAYGLPVIASRVGSVPEVIENGVQGLLVPPHRPDLLAGAMTRLVDDPGQWERMSIAARALTEQRFHLGRLDRDLVRLYDGLIGSGTTGEGLRPSIMLSRAAAAARATLEPTAEPAGGPVPAVP